MAHFVGVLCAMVLFALVLCGYFWLRMGPKRCPDCGKLTWGVWGIPVGIRRMHFHCKACGTRFQGNWRLPV